MKRRIELAESPNRELEIYNQTTGEEKTFRLRRQTFGDLKRLEKVEKDSKNVEKSSTFEFFQSFFGEVLENYDEDFFVDMETVHMAAIVEAIKELYATDTRETDIKKNRSKRRKRS